MTTTPEHDVESARAPEQAASAEGDPGSASVERPAHPVRQHTAAEQNAAALIQVGRQHCTSGNNPRADM